MTAAKIKTCGVPRASYAIYLKRAEECCRAAEQAFSQGDWNAAVITAVHSVISSCDALCIFFLGQRNAGERHDDAVRLFKTIAVDRDGIAAQAGRVSRVLGIKHVAEYEDRLLSRGEAEKVLKDCNRFLDFVHANLLAG